MQLRPFQLTRLIALLALLTFTGCGGNESVDGTVRRDGELLATGKVIFSPIAGGKLAFGAIQPDGTFRLTTERANDGAVAGQYRVMIASGGSAKGGEKRVTYLSPTTGSFEVKSGEANKFDIDVRTSEGWEAVENK